MLRRYDVLHFAGHCVFDEENPAAVGLGLRPRPAALGLRAEPGGPGAQVRLLQRLRVGRALGQREPVLAGPGAQLRRVVLPPRRLQLRLHGLAGRRRRRPWSSRQWVYYCLLGLRPQCRAGPRNSRPCPPCRCTRRCARPGSGSPDSPTACEPGGPISITATLIYRFFDPEAMKIPPRAASRLTGSRSPMHSSSPDASPAADCGPV